ncbi:antitoxin Phd_YefM of type II toxin-antitoxin system [Glutamicibacter mysorens]|uniref:Antitoxin Phd_YefM of type II toxin-antitoxin system n=2 Tax=Glutamicibacter mysorens TaxID=257984 RepID=A0ABX4N2E5_9MICC|nr:antitoxin Phd_YefM of type II toxin-antitoxin system [Glutamicibacter mysorens]
MPSSATSEPDSSGVIGILGRNLYSFCMTTLSITEASRSGLSALVAAAEEGRDTALSRHGKVVAEVVSAQEIAQLRQDRETLRDAALVMARFATDSGVRSTLDQAMEFFNLDRAELEAENAEEAKSEDS